MRTVPGFAGVTGMKLGTGSLPKSRSGAGAQLTRYLVGSFQPLDPDYPQIFDENSDETRIVWRATWPAGKATTDEPLTEIVLVTDDSTEETSPESATIARALIDIAFKGEKDVLVATWTHYIKKNPVPGEPRVISVFGESEANVAIDNRI